jgi:hypothetical protein
MSSCEKCWVDCQRMTFDLTKGRPYSQLLDRRNGIVERECTPEEQAGPDATECQVCKRSCCHQRTGECMNPECEAHKNFYALVDWQKK